MTTASSDAAWRATFPESRFLPAMAFQHAPLALTVEKLARNESLNPADTPIGDAELAVLQSLIDDFQALLRALENEKGAIRGGVLMQALKDGRLRAMSELKGLEADQTDAIEARLAGIAEESDRASRAKELRKEALMRIHSIEAALTTPSGEVFFPAPGTVDAAMRQHLDFQAYLQREFLAAVCSFFFAGGYLDAQARDAILASYVQPR